MQIILFELLKNSSAEDEQKYKDLIGKGFEYKSAHNDDIFTVTYSFDYTKIDLDKLKEKIPGLDLRDDKTLATLHIKRGSLRVAIKKNNSKFLNL